MRVNGGATLATQHAGYTGTGYADYSNASGDHAEWTVPVAAGGPHRIGIRYANGGTADRLLQISVNGTAAGTIPFTPTGGWAAWRTAELTGTLPTGSAPPRPARAASTSTA